MGQLVFVTNEKPKVADTVTWARVNVNAADSGALNAATDVAQVGDAITAAVHVTFTNSSADANVGLAMWDSTQAFIGITPTAQFNATTFTNGLSNVSSRYLFDVGEAVLIKPFVSSLLNGNVDIFVMPLG